MPCVPAFCEVNLLAACVSVALRTGSRPLFFLPRLNWMILRRGAYEASVFRSDPPTGLACMKTTTAFALVGDCVGMITPYHLPPISVAIIYVPGMFLSPLKPSDSPAGCDLAYSMRVAVEFDFIAKKPPPGKYFPFLSLE